MNDVAINKIQTVQRCVLRAREEHAKAAGRFALDHSRQDAAILNVVRACEATLDLANHVVRQRKLGIPTSSADAFRALIEAGVLPADTGMRLVRMVGFRNVAVHAYRELDLDIVEQVIVNGLDDLLLACERLRRAAD